MIKAVIGLLLVGFVVLSAPLPAVAQDGMGRSPYVEPEQTVFGVLVPETNLVFVIDASESIHRNAESESRLLANRIAQDVETLASTTSVHIVLYGVSQGEGRPEDGVLVGPSDRKEIASLLRSLPKLSGTAPGPRSFAEALRRASAWRPDAVILITHAVPPQGIDRIEELILDALYPGGTSPDPRLPPFYCMGFLASAEQKELLSELSKRTGARYRNLPSFLKARETDREDSNQALHGTTGGRAEPSPGVP